MSSASMRDGTNVETRATKYSKAATRGNWNEVWDASDNRKQAKGAGSAANEAAARAGCSRARAGRRSK